MNDTIEDLAKNTQQDNSSLYLLLLTMLMNKPSDNVMLEKEVSYLKGKVDTLENVLTSLL